MFAHIALPHIPIPIGPLTYAIPAPLTTQAVPGSIVEVPYRKGREVGVIVATTSTSTVDKCKEIIRMIHPHPLLTTTTLTIAEEVAAYYLAPLGKVLQSCIPGPLWTGKWKPRYQSTYHLTRPEYTPTARATKEQAILELFQQNSTWTSAALRQEGITASQLKPLLQKAVLTYTSGLLQPALAAPSTTEPLPSLTPTQHTIAKSITPGDGQRYLLHGVTGSGKTEIYMHLAQQVASKGGQTIILVPEIGLTTSMVQRFATYFGSHIALLHSRLSDGERCQEWLRILHNEATIIIGSRSAIFAPCVDCQLIIIDEEHDWSYKNDQTPRYHARAVAEIIQKHTGATCLLGSATPSVETYHRTTTGDYFLRELFEKYHT